MKQEHASILLRVMFRYAILKLVLNIKDGLDSHFMVLFLYLYDYVAVVQDLDRLFN